MKNVLNKILRVYEIIIVSTVSIFFFVFGVVGGKIHIEIYWHHVTDFITAVKKWI